MQDSLFEQVKAYHSQEIFMLQKKFKEDFGENIWRTDELIKSIKEKYLGGNVFIHQRIVCGFCIYKIISDYMEIYSIFVQPSYRKKGVAKKFIFECINYCKNNNLKKIILDVNEENHGAINFYRKNQFIFCGKRKGYYRQNGLLKDSFTMHRIV